MGRKHEDTHANMAKPTSMHLEGTAVTAGVGVTKKKGVCDRAQADNEHRHATKTEYLYTTGDN